MKNIDHRGFYYEFLKLFRTFRSHLTFPEKSVCARIKFILTDVKTNLDIQIITLSKMSDFLQLSIFISFNPESFFGHLGIADLENLWDTFSI